MSFFNKSKLSGLIMLMLFVSMTRPSFAEVDLAPVYDADALDAALQANEPSSFDSNQAIDTSEQVAPPAPSQPKSLTLTQRVLRAEHQIETLQNNTAQSRVDALQAETQTLRNSVDQLTHQLKQLQAQQKSMYDDLDKRVSDQLASAAKAPRVPSAVSDSKPSTTVAANTASTVEVMTPHVKQPNAAEEQEIYQKAYTMIKKKRYSAAVSVLQDMLKKYPSGQFASNAHYWLGELYGLLNKNKQALAEFSTVINNYSDSPRVSDAQLKIGLIYAAESNWPSAKSSFKAVVKQYAGTASAQLAKEQLKQIAQAGH